MTVKLDVRVCAVAVAAAAVLQSLLFMAGWMAGHFAAAPVEPPMIARAPGSDQPRLATPERPIVLRFAALPPLTKPIMVERRRRRQTPLSYAGLIHETAARHNVPPALIAAVIQVESDFNPNTVSSKGARGLMQLMPATAARFGVRNPDQLFHPAPNLAAGTAYLAVLLKRFKGDLDLTLAAYNAGEGAVDKYGGIPPYRETREYVRRVRNVLSGQRSATPL
jgi:soluble lytic murein transglycosylase-like protein